MPSTTSPPTGPATSTAWSWRWTVAGPAAAFPPRPDDNRRSKIVVQVGLLLSDVPKSVTPAQQFKDVLRIVEAAQANGFNHIAIGQHFLYGELRWLQPVPLLARLAAECDPST